MIDRQLKELNEHFIEATTELLVCVAFCSPIDSFFAFNNQKLICLTSFYPNDFSLIECYAFGDKLDAYIHDLCNNNEFLGLRNLSDLAQNLVCNKRSGVYPFVYRLLQLALLLPVATSIVERAFSAIKIIKNRIAHSNGRSTLNDSLVVCIERKKKLNELSNEAIIQRFQKMKTRREQL